jgi:hypothetical protein
MKNALVQEPGPIRTWEMTLSITGAMDVPFEDWPASLQDPILNAMEKLSDKVKLPLAIAYARYKCDPDKSPDEPGRHYVHVIISEIVARAEPVVMH